MGVPNVLPFKDSGENFTSVRFLPLSGDFALSRAAPVELDLNIASVTSILRRAAVDDDTDAAAVGFAESGDAKELAEGVAHSGASFQAGEIKAQVLETCATFIARHEV